MWPARTSSTSASTSDGRPAEVAKVIAVTEEDRQRQAEARVRREQRLLRKRALAEAVRGGE